ncbi:MAG TPA: aldolase/citrate lyase family protein [Candidatus Tectomicrobia bacterium]|jgi:4-hydroxy-2-oxoheptanedioate aldolase
MIENTILKANSQGRKALVFAMTYKDLWAVEAAAQAGFDAISLDGEHGAFSSADVDDIVRVANGYNMSVIARVPNSQPNTINLWLDRGIQGVTGPHIETQEEAQQLADACLFPPDGQRSWGSGRGTEFGDLKILNERYGSRLDFSKWTNRNMIVLAQIESKKAYDNLDGILSVRGLTGITGGPNDLAASLGYPGEPDHPECQRLTADAERRARAAGKTVSGDMTASTGLPGLILGAARQFADEHRHDAYAPPKAAAPARRKAPATRGPARRGRR